MAGSAAAFAAASAIRPAFAQDAPAEAVPFSAPSIVEVARALAAKPFTPPNTADLPAPLANLSYDAYAAIRAKPEGLIWADETSAFAIEPLHRGFIYTSPMQIFLVEDDSPGG